MATTEMESGSSESRSEQGPLDSDSKYPLKVLYCGGTADKLILLRITAYFDASNLRYFCFSPTVCSLPTEVSLITRQTLHLLDIM